MAGIPIVASDFPEIRKVVKKGDVGIVFDPDYPNDFLRVLRELTRSETYEKKAANIPWAQKMYNWENEEKKLLRLYSQLDRRLLKR